MIIEREKMNKAKKQLIEVCNDVFTTEEQQNTTYEINLLIDTFKELKKDGITAVGFSLLVDIVNDRAAAYEWER
jgi:hypothetical protein